MSERFLKFIPSEESFWLIENRPNAFLLLTHIANTARRTSGHPDGLLVGQCHLRSSNKYNLTEREYRTAKTVLVQRNHIKIIETNRTRQKSTTGTTTVSTLVCLISSSVYDINPESNDNRNDVCPTTARQQTRMIKKEKESHPSIPSFSKSGGRDDRTDDFSFFSKGKVEICPGVFLSTEDLEACVQLKGDVEAVREAILFIQGSKKRKQPITDWPNALSRWKIEKGAKVCIEENLAFAEELSRDYADFTAECSCRCRIYHDKNRDQRGILFENQSPYQDSIFIAFADGEFKKKCKEEKEKNLMNLKIIS